MESTPYSPTRNPIASAIHCIVIAAIVITAAMWISDYIHAWIDYAADQRQRSEQLATCQRAGSAQ